MPHATRRCRARPSTRSGTSSPETLPTTNSPAHRAPPATPPPPPGSKHKHPTAPKTTQTFSLITTPPPMTSLTPRARQTRQPRWKTPPDASSRSPENAPSDSTRPRQSPTSSGHWRSPPLATLTAPTSSCSFAEAAQHADRHSDAKEALEEAIPALHARGDLPAQAHALNSLSVVLFSRGDPRWAELPQRRSRCSTRSRPAPR